MTRFKEIISGIRACFAMTRGERLAILLVAALFILGLGLRWLHLSREQSGPLDEIKTEISPSQK
ncbi:MAG: hypothetical protein WC299_07505 [Kiritimatiellia bacterium]